jgi:hypothetical protein
MSSRWHRCEYWTVSDPDTPSDELLQKRIQRFLERSQAIIEQSQAIRKALEDHLSETDEFIAKMSQRSAPAFNCGCIKGRYVYQRRPRKASEQERLATV